MSTLQPDARSVDSMSPASASEPVDIGSRRELMVDDFLIARSSGAELRLHHPVPRDIALVTDQPWEGNMCGYVTVFLDGDGYRMYYKAWHTDLTSGELAEPHGIRIALAESADGVRWTRTELGLFEFQGTKRNNIVWEGHGPEGKGVHGFAPFKDTNPACPPEAQYKAVGANLRDTQGNLHAMASPDGVHWSIVSEDPVITEGAFDSQNLAFWDAVRGEYRAYVRDFQEGCRGIRTATSPDFLCWSTPVWLEYPGAPTEQLYTNQITPYHRAPHIFVGFPTRYVERRWSESIEGLPELEHRRLRASVSERYGAALTDGLFMTSRDGTTFKRWGEAFVRPGPQTEGNWTYGDNYQNWGLVETESGLPGAPRELSMYVSEAYWRGTSTVFRRHTLRLDGFVSAHAPLAGGEILTRPLLFEGGELALNFSGSAAGSLAVEVLDAGTGAPAQGFALADCVELLGDELERVVRWRDAPDLGVLAGRPVRLRFVLRDADLYSFRFR